MQPAPFTWRGSIRPAGLMTKRQHRRARRSKMRTYGVGANERTYQVVRAAARARGISQQQFLDLIFKNWSPA